MLQDIASYEQTQETLALLNVLALTTQQVEAGRIKAGQAGFRFHPGAFEGLGWLVLRDCLSDDRRDMQSLLQRRLLRVASE